MMTFVALLKNKLSLFCGKIYQILCCGHTFISVLAKYINFGFSN